MPEQTVFSNARLVLPDEVVRGTLVIRDGLIEDISTNPTAPKGACDCEGDFLAPGLIELHTDNLERHIRPRPGVDWPHAAAILAHDAEMASAGITTVFDAVRVGSVPNGPRAVFSKRARSLASELADIEARAGFKISHQMHLRAEICSETLIEELAEFGAEDRIGIVSLMNHAPGQRQFRHLDQYKTYTMGKHGLNEDEFAAHVSFLHDVFEANGIANEKAAVTAARALGAVLASHDDTTQEHVEISQSHGVKLAEFPTTPEAAAACHDKGIAVIMGAPNLVRGSSHSGNVAAGALAQADQLDILSSDYVPAALLMGAVQLGEIWGDMARGLGAVTHAPADAAGLGDRGRLSLGQRGDLIRFSQIGTTPVVRGVWSAGEKVA